MVQALTQRPRPTWNAVAMRWGPDRAAYLNGRLGVAAPAVEINNPDRLLPGRGEELLECLRIARQESFRMQERDGPLGLEFDIRQNGAGAKKAGEHQTGRP